MGIKLTTEEKKRIKESLREKYAKVSDAPKGLFRYPTGRAGLEGLNYAPEIINDLPETAVGSYCGVGNPFTLEPIHRGESVLDVGCGGGVDTLIAGLLVGVTGRAVGIDMIPEMLERAKKSFREMPLKGVTFQEASAEELPFPDESFDVVISNGVYNLVPGKEKALQEVLRILRAGGRLMMADQILTGVLSNDTKAVVESWAQ